MDTLTQDSPAVASRRWFDLQRPLPPEDARGRTTAYVYGNVLVLAAVVQATFDHVTVRSVVMVLGTAATTFLAHVFAGAITSTTWSWRTLLHEARDARPILTAGVLPAVLLATALVGLPAPLAVVLAEVLLIVRIAATGVVAARLTSEPTSRSAAVVGIVVAALAVAIVLLKVVLTSHV
jgi:hypothetical protein